jgi:hypothetical protein
LADGTTTWRDHWLKLSRSIRASSRALARQKLTPPPTPRLLGYLRDYTYEVHGRSGVTMDGVPLPVSHAELNQWANLNGITLTDDEVGWIKMLDMLLITTGRAAPTPATPAQSLPSEPAELRVRRLKQREQIAAEEP